MRKKIWNEVVKPIFCDEIYTNLNDQKHEV